MAVSERTRVDLGRAARRRLIEEAGRARKAREAREVAEGVGETLALRQEAGAEFAQPKPGRGDMPKPARRQSGLDVLAKAGKLEGDALRAARAYGDAYRVAQGEASIRSCLADSQPGGEGPTLASIGAKARRRVLAGYRLADMRRALGFQPQLVDACDKVLGQELTPREAGGNAVGSGVYTALVVTACDLIAAATAPSPERSDEREAA